MKCRQCGAELVGGQSVCSQCGSTTKAPRSRRCPRCGARVPHGAALCPQCGAGTAQTARWLRLALSIVLGIGIGVAVFLALHGRVAGIRHDIGRSLLDASGILVAR